MFLGHSGIDARYAAPPDLSQPSTPEFLTTPRHSPRALRGLTTPIGPPRPGKGSGRTTVSPHLSFASRSLAKPDSGFAPGVSRRGRRPIGPIQILKGSCSILRRPDSRRGGCETVCGVCHSPFPKPAPALPRPERRSPAVAAPLGLVSNPKPFAAPPPRKAKRPTTTRIRVSTNHRIVKEAADPQRSPAAVRPWRLARGRGRPPEGRRPRPAPRRRRRRIEPPARLRRRAGGRDSIDRGTAASGRGSGAAGSGPTSAVEDETLTAARLRCKGRVRFPLALLLTNPRGEQAYGRLLGIRGGADEPWGVGEGGLAATLAW